MVLSKQSTISDNSDEIETAIILALHSGKSKSKAVKETRHSNGWTLQEVGLESFCARDTFPEHCYTMDAHSSDRLFSTSWDDIIVDPIIAIGRRLETMMLCEDGALKWSCIQSMPAPRGYVAITNGQKHWYTYHFREIDKAGKTVRYVKRPMCLANGDVAMCKPLGKFFGFDPKQDQEELREQLCLMLSIMEDALRTGSFLATVMEGVRLSFPVRQSAYKDFFALRDAPRATETGRRNPILHWVRKHMRRATVGASEVTQHLRGVETVHIGPMTLSIQSNDGALLSLVAERSQP